MKKIVALIVLLNLFSCKGPKEIYDILRKTPVQKYTPPGTVWLHDNLFIDEVEVTNFSWQAFLYWEKRRDPSSYYLLLPDTNCWTHADIGSADKLISGYFTFSSYHNYPVVGVSYKQIQEFCNWRSDRVNEFLYIREHKLKYSPDSNYVARAPKKVKYRLPGKEEWEYAASAGLDLCSYPMGYESLTWQNKPVNNTLEYYSYFNKDYKGTDKQCVSSPIINVPTLPVYDGKRNRYGLYHMLGNVSEIIADSLVKGLNYSMPIYSLEREEGNTGSYTIKTQSYNYTLSYRYKKPEPWLGFRCICEVLK